MWLFTRYGFFSIVASRTSLQYVVRARNRQHFTKLVQAFPELQRFKIVVLPAADYRYRIEIPSRMLRWILARIVVGITYPNFKAEVEETWGKRGKKYTDALFRIWFETLSFEDSPRRRFSSRAESVGREKDRGTRNKSVRPQSRKALRHQR